jgi:hypothetical protein
VRYPELDLHGLWKLPLAVAGLFAVLGFNLVILPVLVPPMITVSGEQIRYSGAIREAASEPRRGVSQ